MVQDSNFKRALEEVVSINGWRVTDEADECAHDIFMDVSFHNAEMGHDTRSKVLFDLTIKEAQVALIIADGSKLKVDEHSVDRTKPKERKIHSQTKQSKGSTWGAMFSIDAMKGALGKLAFGRSGSNATNTTIEQKERQRQISTQHRMIDGKHHGWILRPEFGEKQLDGSVWDAANERRLRVIDKRTDVERATDEAKGFPLELSIEVRCYEKDLIIEKIRAKPDEYGNDPLEDVKITKRITDNQRAAAEAFLKKRLLDEGLAAVLSGKSFGHVRIADQVVIFE